MTKAILTKIWAIALALTTCSALALQVSATSNQEDAILQKLGKEYGTEVRFATTQEMENINFKPTNTRSTEQQTLESFEMAVRQAIEENIANTHEVEQLCEGDTAIFSMNIPKGTNQVQVPISIQEVNADNMVRSNSIKHVKRDWYPNGGWASIDVETDGVKYGDIKQFTFGHYTPYEGTYHFIPANVSFARIDGGRHYRAVSNGEIFKVINSELIKISDGKRSATFD